MKTSNKLLIIALIVLVPCIFLSGFLTRLIYNKELSIFEKEMESIYGKNQLPEARNPNFDDRTLSELVNEIKKGTYKDVHSLIILQNDSLVLEKYFQDYHRYKLHPLYGATRGFTSALVGIAIQQGKIKDIDEKILNFFPEYSNIAHYNKKKEAITIKHLLTMTAGFEWKELSIPYGHRENDFNRMTASNDWVKFVLDKSVIDVPGNRYVGNSGCCMIISGILRNTTDKSAEEFAIENLFNKIGITHVNWNSVSHGITQTSGGLSLRPIDVLRFGQLYLHYGRWKDAQIIPEDWVKVSTKRWVNATQEYDYGFLWKIYSENHKVTKFLHNNDVYFSYGWGDQFIWLIPHLNMVVVSTAGNYNNDHISYSESMLWDYILPAFRNK